MLMKATLLRSLCLFAAILLSGCSALKVSPQKTIENSTFKTDKAPEPEANQTVLQYAINRFAYDISESAKAATDDTEAPKKALKTFKSGKALIDLQCNAYLDALGTGNQKAENDRKQISLIGGIVAAVGGLTGAAAKDIAISSTLFGFGGASFDAFTEAYLFADAAHSITKLVRDAQKAYMDDVDALPEGRFDYPGTVTLLTGYESICRPSEIRRLVNESITAAKIVAETSSALSAELAVLLGELMKLTGRRVLEGEAISLYAFFLYPDQRDEIKKDSEFIKGLLADKKWTNDQLAGNLAPLFLPLSITGNRVAARWASSLPNVKGVPAKSMMGVQTPEVRPSIAVTAPRVRVQQ